MEKEVKKEKKETVSSKKESLYKLAKAIKGLDDSDLKYVLGVATGLQFKINSGKITG